MGRYLKIKKLLKQLKCPECFGTGDYYKNTRALNNSRYTLTGQERGRFHPSNPNLCAGCEGTGFNKIISIRKLIDKIRKELYE